MTRVMVMHIRRSDRYNLIHSSSFCSTFSFTGSDSPHLLFLDDECYVKIARMGSADYIHFNCIKYYERSEDVIVTY